MEFGIQFFPDIRPEDKSAADYFRDCLDLVDLADPLGYTHIRIVEHCFHYYGGYSPNPIVFLAAAAQRSKTTSTDYKGYDKKYEQLKAQTMESMIASGSALIGTPDDVAGQLRRLNDRIGGFVHASLQVNFHLLPQDEARRSMELFGKTVIPQLAAAGITA